MDLVLVKIKLSEYNKLMQVKTLINVSQ